MVNASLSEKCVSWDQLFAKIVHEMFRLVWNNRRFPSQNHSQSQREIIRPAKEVAQLLYEYASPPLEMIIDRSFVQSKVLGDLACTVALTLELYHLSRLRW